jgi:NAD(P) transhydrogenase subunit alpha
MDASVIDPFVFRLSIFVLAIFVGYFVVWGVTPALHTPLMSVTNAISSVIIVGALIAVSVSTIPHIAHLAVPAPDAVPPTSAQVIQQFQTLEHHESHGAWISKGFGFVALILAAVNIFGGFLVTARMLAMYKKKAK